VDEEERRVVERFSAAPVTGSSSDDIRAAMSVHPHRLGVHDGVRLDR
jgi:hypothetical protein